MVCARTRELLIILLRLANEPIRVLLSVLQPPSLVLASVLHPSASEVGGRVAFTGGDGSGVTGGGLAGEGDRDVRYTRGLGEIVGFPGTELDGEEDTFVIVCAEFERGRMDPALGMMSEAGRKGRAGADRALACESSPSEVSLVGRARCVLAVGDVEEDPSTELTDFELPWILVLEAETCLFLVGGIGNSILAGRRGLSDGEGPGSTVEGDFEVLLTLTRSSEAEAEGLRSFLAPSSFLPWCPNPKLRVLRT